MFSLYLLFNFFITCYAYRHRKKYHKYKNSKLIKTNCKTTTKYTPSINPSIAPSFTPSITQTITPFITHKTNSKLVTLTWFDDTVFSCYQFNNNIPKYALAINPLLLGYSINNWIYKFKSMDSSQHPWCGKHLTLSYENNINFTGVIIDTCDPVGDPFIDPNTGNIIGGKCDYDNVIDLYGIVGKNFLLQSFNDDFFQSEKINWFIY
jgi:hypothetical protein